MTQVNKHCFISFEYSSISVVTCYQLISTLIVIFKDSTFEFERKRNRPERYDRNLAARTLEVIKTIDKVRDRRAKIHIERRFFFLFITILLRLTLVARANMDIPKQSISVESCTICFSSCTLLWQYFFNIPLTSVGKLFRWKGKKEKELREAEKELKQSISMIQAPGALQQEPKIKVTVSQQPEENRMEE